jgi:hypothetical protein
VPTGSVWRHPAAGCSNWHCLAGVYMYMSL